MTTAPLPPDCTACNGTGETTEGWFDRDGMAHFRPGVCTACDGTGKEPE
jgi:DnaJ-class molecular chaperone